MNVDRAARGPSAKYLFAVYWPKIVAAVLIAVLTSAGNAQPGNASPKKIAAIKRKVEALAPGAPIRVVPVQGHDEIGKFVSSEVGSFTFFDADTRANVTMKFAEVRKIQEGYSLAEASIERRNRHRLIVVGVALAVGAALYVLAAVEIGKD